MLTHDLISSLFPLLLGEVENIFFLHQVCSPRLHIVKDVASVTLSCGVHLTLSLLVLHLHEAFGRRSSSLSLDDLFLWASDRCIPLGCGYSMCCHSVSTRCCLDLISGNCWWIDSSDNIDLVTLSRGAALEHLI